MVSVKLNVPKKVKVKKPQKLAKVAKITKVKPVKKTPTVNVSLKDKLVTEVVQKTPDTTEIKKKTKYVMPSKNINEDLVDSCLSALQQLSTNYNKKNTIFEDDTSIFAEINCIKIQNSTGNVKLYVQLSIQIIEIYQ